MATSNLHYEIRELTDQDDALVLELIIEGSRMATARATSDVLDDLRQMLGHDREEVAADLREALRQFLTGELEKVTVSEPIEDPARPLRFLFHFTYKDFDTISAGVLWYDVPTSQTGPENVPAIVRNKARHVVHRKLTREGTNARALVDLRR